jgi:ornithine cyclodeaminase/alanine dehydrogenase-like protein (mu-crystallin family)
MSPTFRVAFAIGAILPAVARVLREAEVLRVLDMDSVIAAVTDAMRELGEGRAQNEPRRRAFAPGAMLNVMFAAYPGGGLIGSKSYSVANQQVRFLVTAFGLDGSLKALIEADNLGAFRTGAASGIAARALGQGGPVTVAMIGTGHQARTQALGLAHAIEIAELRVWSRHADVREAFAAERAGALGVKVVAASSAEQAVRGADVLVTITTSSTPVVESDWVKDGALVIAAGSNFTNRAEIPPDLVGRAHTIVVDHPARKRRPLRGARGREVRVGARDGARHGDVARMAAAAGAGHHPVRVARAGPLGPGCRLHRAAQSRSREPRGGDRTPGLVSGGSS